MAAGPVPLVDGLLGEYSLGAVVGEEFGLRLRGLRKVLLEHLCENNRSYQTLQDVWKKK